ncbi:hypothetical protein J6590_053747 [Homalodisca vitripennis]|nr:hypothetical protein J6590_053747 [Homalodisca vitripennis]
MGDVHTRDLRPTAAIDPSSSSGCAIWSPLCNRFFFKARKSIGIAEAQLPRGRSSNLHPLPFLPYEAETLELQSSIQCAFSQAMIAIEDFRRDIIGAQRLMSPYLSNGLEELHVSKENLHSDDWDELVFTNRISWKQGIHYDSHSKGDHNRAC